MNDNLSRAGLIILLIFTILISFAYFNRNSDNQVVKIIRISDPNCIPSAREIQERLTALGNPRYDPNGIDGVIGKDSRTAWDNYICDQQAIRAIEGE